MCSCAKFNTVLVLQSKDCLFKRFGQILSVVMINQKLSELAVWPCTEVLWFEFNISRIVEGRYNVRTG